MNYDLYVQAVALFNRLSVAYKDANNTHNPQAGRIWRIALAAARRVDRRRKNWLLKD